MKKETEKIIAENYGMHRLNHLAAEIRDIYDDFEPYSFDDYSSMFETEDEILEDLADGLINCPDETIEYLTSMITEYGIDPEAPFYKKVASTLEEVKRFTEAITL